MKEDVKRDIFGLWVIKINAMIMDMWVWFDGYPKELFGGDGWGGRWHAFSKKDFLVDARVEKVLSQLILQLFFSFVNARGFISPHAFQNVLKSTECNFPCRCSKSTCVNLSALLLELSGHDQAIVQWTCLSPNPSGLDICFNNPNSGQRPLYHGPLSSTHIPSGNLCISVVVFSE